MSPIGKPVSSFFQLNIPVTICCETPAIMNNPTPEPMPHLETISSMYKIKMPPMHIWMNNNKVIMLTLMPSCAASPASGRI
ncbi:Uncharacterised protein [uncultured archaeon]|nr:Uncharacterised protein [uncultured archaeon]